MKPHSASLPLLLSIVLPLGMPALAADMPTDRTSMPDFCSNRDVICVLHDGPLPARRAAAGRGAAATVVLTPPVGSTAAGANTAVPAVPALPAQVPSLFGEVPALPGQVPTATVGGLATGTTSSSTAGSLEGPAGATRRSGADGRNGSVTSGMVGTVRRH